MRNAMFTRRCQGCVAIVSIGKLCPDCLSLARRRTITEKPREMLSLDPENGRHPLSMRALGLGLPVSECPHQQYYQELVGRCSGCGYTAEELVALGHAKRRK